MRTAFFLIPIVFFLNISLCFSQIVVSATHPTPSTCPNNGSILIVATSANPPLYYSIISGPVTVVAQTTPFFNSLFPGDYVVKVSDAAQNEITVNATVAGNYMNPMLDVKGEIPYCRGESSGDITAEVRNGTGLAPYTWELVNYSGTFSGVETEHTFENLPAGNYTVRVTDACGSFSSSAYTVQEPVTAFKFQSYVVGQEGYIRADKMGCDSMMVSFTLDITESRMPLSFKYQTSDGIFIPQSGTEIDTSMFHVNGWVFVRQIVPGLDYDEKVRVTIYNTCGDSAVSVERHTYPFKFYPKYAYKDCGKEATVTFGNTEFNEYHTGLKTPLKYTYKNLTTGEILLSETAWNHYGGPLGLDKFLPVGGNYHFEIEDGCGDKFATNFTIPQLAPPVIIHEDMVSGACIDSVVGTYRILTLGFENNAKLILLSGPSVLGSTKERYEYTDTYTYPDTVPMAWGETFLMNNLAVGTYQYKIIDSCGNEIPGSFTIEESQLTSLKVANSVERGCVGKNKIYYSMVMGGDVIIRDIVKNVELKKTEFLVYTHNYMAEQNNKDSLLNLSEGSYEITYLFKQHIGSLENGHAVNDSDIACWEIVDTVYIAPYQNPEISVGNAVICKNDIQLVLVPDLKKGVPPYTYEIISGPQIFPRQTSPIFSIKYPGNYIARIIDECGNATVKQVTADTLEFLPVESGTSCDSKIIILPSSPYFIHEWTSPDGEKFIGDTLNLEAITSADTGLYRIIRITNINGCTDTAHASYRVNLSQTLKIDTSICAGEQVVIGQKTYSITGIYQDTLTTQSGCDSILVINLTVHPFPVVDLGEDKKLCTGAELTLDAGNQGAKYLWNNQSTTQQISVSQAGQYSVSVTQNYCSSADTIQIALYPEYVLNLGNDTLLCNNDTLLLNANQVPGTYLWQDGSTLPILVIKTAGTYQVIIQTDCGELEDAVQVDFEECNCKLNLPTAFSPNMDGKNDVFGVSNFCSDIDNFKLMVFNRWGEKVFESNDQHNFWDGTYKGSLQEIGVYAWVLTYENKGQGISRKGAVTFVK